MVNMLDFRQMYGNSGKYIFTHCFFEKDTDIKIKLKCIEALDERTKIRMNLKWHKISHFHCRFWCQCCPHFVCIRDIYSIDKLSGRTVGNFSIWGKFILTYCRSCLLLQGSWWFFMRDRHFKYSTYFSFQEDAFRVLLTFTQYKTIRGFRKLDEIGKIIPILASEALLHETKKLQ